MCDDYDHAYQVLYRAEGAHALCGALKEMLYRSKEPAVVLRTLEWTLKALESVPELDQAQRMALRSRMVERVAEHPGARFLVAGIARLPDLTKEERSVVTLLQARMPS